MARIKEKTKMKKLLVLTDFTANAAHAAKAAVQFSSKLHADLLLYHSVIAAAPMLQKQPISFSMTVRNN
jgi:nucleotide-binding universal stress UspA family protein